jgi:flagellar biosynthesis/type III secretory pathway protein FliH
VKRIFLRWISATALTIIAAVVLSGIALAQYAPYDDDNYYQRGSARQAHQYGYQSGYRDGYGKGRHEGRENDPGDINIRALQDATHGYQPWMGPIRYFQDGYRDGYSRGFRSGYDAVNRRWEDRDDDDDEY